MYSLKKDVIFKIFFKTRLKFTAIIINEFLGKNITEKDIEVSNTVIEPDAAYGKTMINDVTFKIPNSTIVFMEMQNYFHKGFRNRIEWYLISVLRASVNSGDSYENFFTIHGIFFINTDKDFKKTFTKLSLFDKIDETEGLLNVTIVNLYYFNPDVFSKEVSTLLAYMKVKEEKEMDNMKNTNSFSKEVYDEIKRLSGDPQYAHYILQLEKEELDRIAILNEKSEEAHNTGMKKGIEQGIEQEKKETIKKLLNVLDENTIAKTLNIELSYVQELNNGKELK